MHPAAHDDRFSPTGFAAAVGAHVMAIAGIWWLGAQPVLIPPVTLTAYIIPSEAPPAPEVEPPRPKPVVQPPPPRERPQPRPVPRPTPREPEVLAARSSEPATFAQSAPRQEESPVPVAAPATAPVELPVARAAPAPAPVLTQPRFDADYLHNPAPSYPPLSRRMGEEGKVMLRVFVEPDGRPSQVVVKEGSGSPRLDRAAEEAVARWKFVPARRGEEAVGAWVVVPIMFSLRG